MIFATSEHIFTVAFGECQLTFYFYGTFVLFCFTNTKSEHIGLFLNNDNLILIILTR